MLLLLRNNPVPWLLLLFLNNPSPWLVVLKALINYYYQKKTILIIIVKKFHYFECFYYQKMLVLWLTLFPKIEFTRFILLNIHSLFWVELLLLLKVNILFLPELLITFLVLSIIYNFTIIPVCICSKLAKWNSSYDACEYSFWEVIVIYIEFTFFSTILNPLNQKLFQI